MPFHNVTEFVKTRETQVQIFRSLIKEIDDVIAKCLQFSCFNVIDKYPTCDQ